MKKMIIDRKEVLSYLGLRGRRISRKIEEFLSSAEEEVFRYMKKITIGKRFRIQRGEGGIELSETGIVLPGVEVKKLLRSSEEIVLITASLGEEIGDRITIAAKRNPAYALVLDAVASAAVTALLQAEEGKVAKELSSEGYSLTDRFGAGYGDLPLSVQKGLWEATEAKNFGISCDDRFFLSPEKTLTTFSGIIKKPELRKGETCGICRFSELCGKRKEMPLCYCLGRAEEEDDRSVFLPKAPSLIECLLRSEESEVPPRYGKIFLQREGKSETGLSALVLAHYLRLRGILPEEVPPELSAEGIIALLKERGLFPLVFSVTMFADLSAFGRKVRQIKSEIPDCKIIAGGGMLTEDEFKMAGGDLFLADVREVPERLGEYIIRREE